MLKVGDKLDGFTLTQKMGVGGMGSVWRASHPDIHYPIVLKAPFLDPEQDVSTIVGFETEEMILKRLSGPHVPRFAGSGDLSETPFLAMEFVAGENLGEKMTGQKLPASEIAKIGADVATALASIHRQKVAHFDLKPDNIFLTGNGAVIIDFGLARHFELPDLFGEESSGPMGTPAYIAPEQVLGNRNNTQSDIFALGCILYELATGQKPFGEPATTAGMKRRIFHPAPPIRSANPQVPRWLATVINKCLEVDIARRYANAGNVAFDLSNPDQVAVSPDTKTGEGETGFLQRLFRRKGKEPDYGNPAARLQSDNRAVVLVAVDLSNGVDALAEEVRAETARVLFASPGARLACLTVRRTEIIALDKFSDEDGRSLYVTRLVALKDWARPLDLPAERVSFHVFEAASAASVILNFASHNDVGLIVIGARASSALRRHLGSVSTEVVAKALCSVSVVRVKQIEEKALEAAGQTAGNLTSGQTGTGKS
jgi:eukaryotic-like serine/threonine-protein kinase